MRYTLNIQGGPSRESLGEKPEGNVEFKLKIKDESIATINQHNEILGHKVGDTMIEGLVVHSRGEDQTIISSRSVSIRVRLVTHVAIPHNTLRVIYSGSLLKKHVELRHNDEVFSHGVAPISYNWQCASNFLKMYLPRDVKGLAQG